jgi:hypothetical protein
MRTKLFVSATTGLLFALSGAAFAQSAVTATTDLMFAPDRVLSIRSSV